MDRDTLKDEYRLRERNCLRYAEEFKQAGDKEAESFHRGAAMAFRDMANQLDAILDSARSRAIEATSCYHQFGLCRGRQYDERWDSLACKATH